MVPAVGKADEPVVPAPLKPSLVGSKTGSLSDLSKVLEVGKGIVIQNIPNSGRGLVNTIFMQKSQYICNYDGNRVDATTGQLLMVCKRTRDVTGMPF